MRLTLGFLDAFLPGLLRELDKSKGMLSKVVLPVLRCVRRLVSRAACSAESGAEWHFDTEAESMQRTLRRNGICRETRMRLK